MQLYVAKCIVLVCVFLLTFLLSVLPLKLMSVVKHTLDPQRRQSYRNVLSMLNCFGGGVFLGTCFIDLFPEVRETLGEALDRLDIVTSFPVAEFVMVFGLFVAFTLEQIVLSCKESGMPDESQPLLSDSMHGHNRTYRTNVEDAEEVSVAILPSIDTHKFDSRSFYSDLETHSTLRCVVLMLALSLHSVFEGFAIGLQDSLTSLVQILAAIAIHKSVVAFSLGLNLVQSKLRLRTLILMDFVFSIMTPIGIASGIGILRLSHSVDLVSGLLQGIACGTFLFVTFFEVLPHEMNGRHQRLPKVLATIFGFAAVCCAIFLHPSDEKPSCFRNAQPVH